MFLKKSLIYSASIFVCYYLSRLIYRWLNQLLDSFRLSLANQI
jgi:hypothetical protein